MAVESEKVAADVIEVSEFPLIARRYHVYAVPKVVVNERVSFEGALPERLFLQKIIEATAEGTGI